MHMKAEIGSSFDKNNFYTGPNFRDTKMLYGQSSLTLKDLKIQYFA